MLQQSHQKQCEERSNERLAFVNISLSPSSRRFSSCQHSSKETFCPKNARDSNYKRGTSWPPFDYTPAMVPSNYGNHLAANKSLSSTTCYETALRTSERKPILYHHVTSGQKRCESGPIPMGLQSTRGWP